MAAYIAYQDSTGDFIVKDCTLIEDYDGKCGAYRFADGNVTTIPHPGQADHVFHSREMAEVICGAWNHQQYE